MTCSKCGRAVPPGEPWCEVCKGPAVFSDAEVERMRVDVRARILWADPVETIRDDWLKKGAPAGVVNSTLEAAIRERHRHFRVRGIQDVLMALGSFAVGAAAIYLFLDGYRGAALFIAMVGAPCVGLSLCFRGIGRIASGGKKENAASDLSETR
jgi:hypothetical protein